MQILLAAGFMAGIAVWWRWGVAAGLIPGLAAAAIIFGLLRRPRATVLGLTLLAAALGMARAAAHSASSPPPAAVLGEGTEAHVIGSVARAPEIDRKRPLLLDIEAAGPNYFDDPPDGDASPAPAQGRIHVYAFSPTFFEGQRLEVTGVLRLYDRPASSSGRLPMGRLDHAIVNPLPSDTPSVTGALAGLRGSLRRAIRRALPEPHAALLSAILLGVRSDIPSGLTQAMNAAGLTHLIAISGYNVTLLAVVVRRLAGFVLGRRAVLLVVIVLPLYAAMVGGDPPVVRATIMSELVLIAWLIGRESHLPTTLTLAAAAMVFADPDVLTQVSFQLSFAATLGLVALAPRIAQALKILPRLLAEGTAVSISAQLLVMPLLALHFGRLSPLGVPANLMALPFTPWVMLTGVVTMFWSLLSLPGTHIVAWTAWAPLECLIWLARFWGDLAPSQALIPKVADWSVALSYLALGGVLWWAGRRGVQAVAEHRGLRPWTIGAAAAMAFLAPPAAGAAVSLLPPPGELSMVAVLEGSRPTIYGRTAGGVNFIIAGSSHDETAMQAVFPFHAPSVDVVVLRDLRRASTAMAAAVAERRRIHRIWASDLDFAEDPAEGLQPLVISIDEDTVLEVMPPVGSSTDPALRLSAGDFSLLLPPRDGPPLRLPAAWRSALLVLAGRYGAGYTDPKFLKAMGIQAVAAGGGPDGSATIVPASAIRWGAAQAPLGPASPSRATLALTWDGQAFYVSFPD